MKKEKKCTKCFQSVSPEISCDTCGKNLLLKFLGIPITISFGYGDELDGEEYHFCNKGEVIRFLADELRKQNPRTDLKFGKEK